MYLEKTPLTLETIGQRLPRNLKILRRRRNLPDAVASASGHTRIKIVHTRKITELAIFDDKRLKSIAELFPLSEAAIERR